MSADRIQSLIAAINLHRTGSAQLSTLVQGMSDVHGCAEYFFVETLGGEMGAIGYSEAELLHNLEQVLAEAGVLSTLTPESLVAMRHMERHWLIEEQAGLREHVAYMRRTGRDFTPEFAEALAALRAVNKQLEAEGVRQ